MKLENQVISLETAKKLKDLGIKQESLFWWVEDILVFKTKTGFFNELGAGMNIHPLIYKAISAFTVAELGEMLPEGMVYHTRIMDTNLGERRIDLSFQELKCGQPQGNSWKGNTRADTEAEVRGKMLIYLLENNLVTIKE